MKIIHLSDTHVGRDDNEARLQLLIQDIFLLGDPREFVIVHTGDLIDQGVEHQMLKGRQILDQLLAKGWRVLLCPGNHDYGNAAKIDPTRATIFREYFSNFIFETEPAKFPTVRFIDDCAFIGLDSNEAEMGFLARWFAEGHLGERQIAHLSAILDTPEVRDRFVIVYLHHHPFLDTFMVKPDFGSGAYLSSMLASRTRRFRRLKDAHALMQCIHDRVDLLLFGHQHFGLDHSGDSRRYGVPLALDGSSSTAAQMTTDRMRYRVIDTVSGQIEIRLVPFP